MYGDFEKYRDDQKRGDTMSSVISVGDLVGLVLRSGDIDVRFGSGSRMLEGQEVHRAIQGTYEEGWEREVGFKKHYPDLQLTLQGRADGVFHERGIHEIKSTRRKLEDWDQEGETIHWAQAYCYAHMLAIEKGLEKVEVLLTYANAITDDRRDFTRTLDASWLETYVDQLIDQYRVWMAFQQDWQGKRTTSLKEMPFPYGDYRTGQRKLAASVYSAIRDEFIMMAEAPTGVGKTVSTLFPALKAMGEEKTDKIFYLTAKTVARTVAEESLKHMRLAGAQVKSVTLTAKEKICFTSEKKCNPEDCTYAKGHFDRINICLMDALSTEDHMDRLNVEKYAEKHHVCPGEFALDVASFSDVIVCDYNYVFDPLAKLQRFFVEVTENYVFLVDEAHNLPHRGREMFSASVCREDVLTLRKAFPKKTDPYKALGKLNSQMLAIQKDLKGSELEFETHRDVNGQILATLSKAFDACVMYLLDTENFELKTSDQELMLRCYRFNFMSDYFSEGHLWVNTEEDSGTCKMMCIDPSSSLRGSYANAKACIIFSATMAPYAYYEEVLGIEGCRKLVLDSPFPPDNRKMILGAGVDTRLGAREKHYGRMVAYILSLVKSKKANYLVFCPSYQFLKEIESRIVDLWDEGQVVTQTTGMDENAKATFLEYFEGENQECILGLAVLGGSFSEGIDLVGSRLEGVVIIGMGTPYMSPENELIKRFYDEQNKNGYTYAYVYPAINKIVQAVGRLIRTEKDRGVALFLDDRYLHPRYKLLLPSQWQIKKLSEPEEVFESHLKFWLD